MQINRYIDWSVLVLVSFFVLMPVRYGQAEEISEAHLKAAGVTIEILGATEPLNEILPVISSEIKATLSRSNPALSVDIERIVDELTLNLLDERLALEEIIREIWAERFTQEELQAITEFYRSDVGKKLSDQSADLNILTLRAAEQWRRELAETMFQRAQRELQKVENSQESEASEDSQESQ